MGAIASIVEGHGDREAIPILIRRIGASLTPPVFPAVEPPLRVPRSKLIKPHELERAVEFSARRAGPGGAVLLILDADDDCPATLGPELQSRAFRQRANISIGTVLAKREYEAWFLAAAESLRGRRGLSDDLTSPNNPEDIRGAKVWLTAHKTDGSSYLETLDQPALTDSFDLGSARRADSFDKCHREIERPLRNLIRNP